MYTVRQGMSATRAHLYKQTHTHTHSVLRVTPKCLTGGSATIDWGVGGLAWNRASAAVQRWALTVHQSAGWAEQDNTKLVPASSMHWLLLL
jgi:hypothetical protein